MATRSKSLAVVRLVLSAADTTLYTVPAGKVTIVRSIRVTNIGALADAPSLYIGRGAATVIITAGISIPSGQTFKEEIWTVLAAADSLHITQGIGQQHDVVVSGAELVL
jgi:hypothetical protein